MTWKIHFIEDPPAVRVHCSGNISEDDLTMLAIETCFAVKGRECDKILLDLSEATLGFAPDGLCRLLDLYAEYRVPITTSSAIVLSATAASPLEYSKVLHTCKEYGYSMILIVGGQWANSWLTSTES